MSGSITNFFWREENYVFAKKFNGTCSMQGKDVSSTLANCRNRVLLRKM